jgi:3-oxoadipate enol-lactonase
MLEGATRPTMTPNAMIEGQTLQTAPRIAVVSAGAGDTVMFLHGLGSTKENWYPQLEYFSKTYRVIAWDARGYGQSEDYEGDLDFARDFVGDLLNVLELLEVERVHLVGLSMGGMIAQCFYFAYPDRVRSLVLAGAFPSFPALGEELVQRFLANRVDPLLRGASPADLAASAADSLLAPGAPRSARKRLLTSLSNVRVDSYVKTARALAAQGAMGDLKNIAAPTLLVCGALDSLSPPRLARKMSDQIPACRLVVIPGAGHLSNLERPKEFNLAVSEFLKSQANASRQDN